MRQTDKDLRERERDPSRDFQWRQEEEDHRRPDVLRRGRRGRTIRRGRGGEEPSRLRFTLALELKATISSLSTAITTRFSKLFVSKLVGSSKKTAPLIAR